MNNVTEVPEPIYRLSLWNIDMIQSFIYRNYTIGKQYSYRNVFSPQLPMASDLKSGMANKSSLGNSYCTSVNFSMADSSFGASPETYRNWSKRPSSENTYTGLWPAAVPALFETNPLTTNEIMCVAIGGVWTKMSPVFSADLLKQIFVHSRSAFFIEFNDWLGIIYIGFLKSRCIWKTIFIFKSRKWT